MKRKLSSMDVFYIVAIVLFGMISIGVLTQDRSSTQECDRTEYWIPTEEDIAYQDSMWIIIKQTQYEVDTIKESIDQIIIRLEDID